MKRSYRSFDYLLCGLVFTVCIIGIVLIGSATHVNIKGMTPDFKGQLIWFFSGIVLMFFAAFIDYHFICKFYILIYIVNLMLLLTVLALGSQNDSGATVSRWLDLGPLGGIQPSEFSKVFMILFLAKFVSLKEDTLNNFSNFILVMILIMVPFYLVWEQPSLSASLVIITVSASVLFVGKLSYKYILSIIGTVVPTAFFVIQDALRTPHIFVDKILKGYQIKRIVDTFLSDPTSDGYYQTSHSIQAIGSGQLNGKGLYQGVLNQMNYVPYSHNDFIVAVLGEEFGFVGCVVMLTLMLVIIALCFRTAYTAVDLLGKLIATGVGCMLAFQVFVNFGVATGMLFNTGMPLPFMSYGGSSMWTSMIAVGLVINVRMTKNKSVFEG